jgi:aldehyde:ferredoxin oxidoreductase
MALTQSEFDHALDEYYRIAGWNADGVPMRETMEKLDLAWAL